MTAIQLKEDVDALKKDFPGLTTYEAAMISLKMEFNDLYKMVNIYQDDETSVQAIVKQISDLSKTIDQAANNDPHP